MKKAIIKKVRKGKAKGQFIFVLKSTNGQVVANSLPETYHNKQDAEDTITNNFPEFVIVDESEIMDSREKGFVLVDDTE